MTWANFYLVCFLVGFLLSLVSLLLGCLDLNIHLPHAGDGFHVHVGGHGGGDMGVHGGHVGHGMGDVAHGGEPHAEAASGQVSPLNFGTVAAFLAWFGGSGYLLNRYSPFWTIVGFGVAVGFGLAGAAVVFVFLLKLASHDENLDPADYEMVGVLARISSGIRPGGTGEIIFTQAGGRSTSGARADDGTEMPRGTEVVVTRYEKGIAYVRRWEDLANER